MSKSVTVDAPGKINLTLEILGKRSDGYHDLRSVLVPVSLFETVTVCETDGGDVSCSISGDGVDTSELGKCPPEKNLAVRAALMMKDLCGTAKGCRISIVKRVPIGAGMGGGSADAAGTVEALRRLWMPAASRESLTGAAAALGSDVPAQLLGGAVVMEGRGERVRPVFGHGEKAAAPFWLVVVFPGFAVSTGRMYSLWTPDLTPDPEICKNAVRSVRNGDVREASRTVFNGLQNTVGRYYPETERFCLALRESGALSALLSGSGSAVFGLAESREHADAVRGRLPRDVWSRVVSTLPDGVMAAHGPLTP